MTTLTIRAYNVRFGDAILISWPERSRQRHILIDVGNVLSTEGGDDAVFEPVVKNILEVLDGRPLDLYVMTHEHLDHVQGLPYASNKLGLELDVKRAWLTASAEPNYYDKNRDAEKALRAASATYMEMRKSLMAHGADDPPAELLAMVENNDGFMAAGNPSRVKECVSYLRDLADETFYVHRGFDASEGHTFRDARIAIWGPEQDTAEYYGRFKTGRPQPIAPMVSMAGGATRLPAPPSGVDAGAFYDLLRSREAGNADNLLSIDRAANNTSIVFCLEWRGWKLLFPGDAEERSWRTMEREGVLEPVHFLKVGHHGSSNGTPPASILEKVMPSLAPDDRPRRAVVSTHPKSYPGVPATETLRELAARCAVDTTTDVKDGHYVEIELPG